MSQYLPPGCPNTDPPNPMCEGCGCGYDAHYEEDKNIEIYESEPLNVNGDFEYMCIELNALGQVVHACDSLLGKHQQCTCEGFQE